LVDARTKEFVDDSVFANSNTLNDQEAFLSDLCTQLSQQYVPVELIHAESGPGQLEVVLEYCSDAVEMADKVVVAKETIKAVARQHGCLALFLPKYDLTKAGNGMHIHISTHTNSLDKKKTGTDRSFCDGNSLTPAGGAFVEGLLRHLPALLGLSLPTVNSFRRVGPGCWTGSVVGWNLEDKECAIRVCSNLATKEWDHVEYKLCDGSCNLYLALAAILSAGMDGIQNEWSLRPALGNINNVDGTPVEEALLPGSVSEAFDALEKDETIMGLLGTDGLGKGYLALRRNEYERAHKMSLEDEVKEYLARS
jgi:glutamine synthetase